MKVKRKRTKNFQPIVITVESGDEAVTLYRALSRYAGTFQMECNQDRVHALSDQIKEVLDAS